MSLVTQTDSLGRIISNVNPNIRRSSRISEVRIIKNLNSEIKLDPDYEEHKGLSNTELELIQKGTYTVTKCISRKHDYDSVVSISTSLIKTGESINGLHFEKDDLELAMGSSRLSM